MESARPLAALGRNERAAAKVPIATARSFCPVRLVTAPRVGYHRIPTAMVGMRARSGCPDTYRLLASPDALRTQSKKEMPVTRVHARARTAPATRRFRVQWALPLLSIALLFAAGCSSDDSPTDTPASLFVDLTAPANGVQVSGSVVIVATAREAEQVLFLVDGTQIGADSTNPFAFSWNSATVSNGGHRITAAAVRGAERVEDSVDIVVNNAGGGIGVAVSPTAATVALSQSRLFTASVVGATNLAVTWSIDEGASRGAIDASGLYTAPIQLPSPPTATVRATSVEDPSKSATAIVTLTGGTNVQVTIAPPSVQVQVGQTQQFTATVTGNANTQVTWTVIEGASFGAISANGLYTAPATVPSPATATIRATSVAEPGVSASATVTITGGAGGPFTAAELSAIRAAYWGGFQTRDFINDANDVAANAFFFASCQNGNQDTLTGTLTETAVGSGQFTYGSQPTDRMHVVFGNGVALDIFFQNVSGDLGELECDDALGFLNAHDDFRYRMVSSVVDITVASAVIPQDEFEKSVSQSIEGSITLNNETWTAQGQMTGTFIFIFSEFATNTHDTLHIETLLTSGSKRAEISHDFDFKDDFFSSSGDSFSERTDNVQSTGSADGGATVFRWQDVVHGFTDTNERSPIFSAEGALLRNGTAIGNLVVNSATDQLGIELIGGGIVEL